MPLNYYSENETKDSNPDIYFMRQALQEAQKAALRDEVPVGAVVVCQGRIIARGHNLTETLTDVTAHANAGLPVLQGTCTVFPESPEMMAEFAPRLAKAGANIIGGCCGTTPDHIQSLVKVLK